MRLSQNEVVVWARRSLLEYCCRKDRNRFRHARLKLDGVSSVSRQVYKLSQTKISQADLEAFKRPLTADRRDGQKQNTREGQVSYLYQSLRY